MRGVMTRGVMMRGVMMRGVMMRGDVGSHMSACQVVQVVMVINQQAVQVEVLVRHYCYDDTPCAYPS